MKRREKEEEEIIKWLNHLEEKKVKIQGVLVELRRILFFENLSKDRVKEKLLKRIEICKKTLDSIEKEINYLLKNLQYLRISKLF